MNFSRADNHVKMWRFSDVSGIPSPSSGCAGGLVAPKLMTKTYTAQSRIPKQQFWCYQITNTSWRWGRSSRNVGKPPHLLRCCLPENISLDSVATKASRLVYTYVNIYTQVEELTPLSWYCMYRLISYQTFKQVVPPTGTAPACNSIPETIDCTYSNQPHNNIL